MPKKAKIPSASQLRQSAAVYKNASAANDNPHEIPEGVVQAAKNE